MLYLQFYTYQKYKVYLSNKTNDTTMLSYQLEKTKGIFFLRIFFILQAFVFILLLLLLLYKNIENFFITLLLYCFALPCLAFNYHFWWQQSNTKWIKPLNLSLDNFPFFFFCHYYILLLLYLKYEEKKMLVFFSFFIRFKDPLILIK